MPTATPAPKRLLSKSDTPSCSQSPKVIEILAAYPNLRRDSVWSTSPTLRNMQDFLGCNQETAIKITEHLEAIKAVHSVQAWKKKHTRMRIPHTRDLKDYDKVMKGGAKKEYKRCLEEYCAIMMKLVESIPTLRGHPKYGIDLAKYPKQARLLGHRVAQLATRRCRKKATPHKTDVQTPDFDSKIDRILNRGESSEEEQPVPALIPTGIQKRKRNFESGIEKVREAKRSKLSADGINVPNSQQSSRLSRATKCSPEAEARLPKSRDVLSSIKHRPRRTGTTTTNHTSLNTSTFLPEPSRATNSDARHECLLMAARAIKQKLGADYSHRLDEIEFNHTLTNWDGLWWWRTLKQHPLWERSDADWFSVTHVKQWTIEQYQRATLLIKRGVVFPAIWDDAEKDGNESEAEELHSEVERAATPLARNQPEITPEITPELPLTSGINFTVTWGEAPPIVKRKVHGGGDMAACGILRFSDLVEWINNTFNYELHGPVLITISPPRNYPSNVRYTLIQDQELNDDTWEWLMGNASLGSMIVNLSF